MSIHGVSDEQLMQQVAAANPDALEALYDRYAPTVMGLAVKLIGEPSAAEEIVQEAFWRVWRNAASFERQRGAFSGWLFGIARNLAIDFFRRRRVRPQPVSDDADEQRIDRMSDPDADVPEAAWLAIQRTQVRAAMQGLPAAQRSVIEMAYYRGMTRQEIAEATGEPLGTIHTRARLALQKLREALSAQGFET
jgi:RNA polymerase sigma-70 factor (ECF subfamily)